MPKIPEMYFFPSYNADLTGAQDGSVRMFEWGHSQQITCFRPGGNSRVTRMRFNYQGNKVVYKSANRKNGLILLKVCEYYSFRFLKRIAYGEVLTHLYELLIIIYNFKILIRGQMIIGPPYTFFIEYSVFFILWNLLKVWSKSK